ncbi:MAG: DUF11 domain-containing protein, partial [Gemmatimonadetes bacterium]|nr:DUF11 domain-containing protein [Gemmatimonadota bacterium]
VESLVGLPADLRIRKFGRLLAVRGDTLEYVLHVHNDGPGDARDVVVVDSVPPGATLVSNPESGQASEGVLTWTLGSLAPGTEVFLRYDVTYEVPGIYRNLSAVTSPSDPLPDNDESWHATRIDERHGLAPGAEVPTDSTPTFVSGLVIAADGPALTAVGQPNGYWAIAVNRGPEALSNVQLSLSIPVGAAVDGVTGEGFVSGSAVVWQVDDLPVEGQIFGSVDVSYPDPGIKEVVASVAAGGLDATPPAADTVRTEVVGARPLLSLSGTASALPDEVVTYVVTLDRVGPGPLDGVVVEDSLPEGARFVGASRGGQLQGRVVRWPAVQLSEGVGPVVDTVQVTYGESGPYENRVVTSPRFPGARDSFTTVVGLAADVRIDLLGAEVSLAGDTVLYNVHVYNAGSGVAQNLELTLDPASGSQVVLADGGDIDADGFVTWPQLDTLGPGSEFWTGVEVIHGRPGIYRHRATVTSAFDPDLVDTFAERITYVLPRRLQVELAGPGEASARDSLTYVIESTYRGIGDLGPGYVELALPAAATVIPNGDSSAVDGVVRIPVPEGFQAGLTRSDTVRISFPYGGRYDLVGTVRGGNLMAADTLAIAVHPLTHPTPTSVHFGFDSANIRPFEAADLIQIAQQLRALDPRIGIVLVGHADTVGATDYNQRLGQERADSVQAFLARWGVATPRTRTRSRGETQQLSTEGTWESHAKDRRVEFHFCDPADPELLDFWPCSDFDFPEQVSQRTPGLSGQSLRLTRGPPDPPFRSRHPPSLIPGPEANPNPTLLSDRKKRP